jgi:hypothetical protein
MSQKTASSGCIAPDIAFYVQSALESAQLLLLTCLGSAWGEFRVLAISVLGWPASLMDLALDVLARSGSQVPVYVVTCSPCPMVGSFWVEMAPDPRAPKPLTALAEVCDRTQDPATVRGALSELS